MTKLLWMTAWLLLAATPALAGGRCVEGSCENGTGTYVLEDGTHYHGQFGGNGVAHGYGRITYPSGNSYEGDFVEDLYEGYGTYTSQEGVYVGQFKAGRFDGQGTHVYRKGGVYVGQWQAGRYHGRGTYVYPSGKSYIGVWQQGELVNKETAAGR